MATDTITVTTTRTVISTIDVSSMRQIYIQLENGLTSLVDFELRIKPTPSANFELLVNDSLAFTAPSGLLKGVSGPLGFNISYDLKTMLASDKGGIIIDVNGISDLEISARVAAGTSIFTSTYWSI